MLNFPCQIFLALVFVITAGPWKACADSDSIKIGWIGPLSGNASVLGSDGMPALQMAIEEINTQGGVNGVKLNLLVEDDQYIPAKTLTAYQKLVHLEQVKIIVVVSYSGLFAIAPHAVHDGVILIDPLDCDGNIGALPRNIICVAKISEDLGYVMADHVLRRNESPVGVIYYDGDAFMGVVAKALKQRLQTNPGMKSLMLTYSDATTDFKPQLLKLKKQHSKTLVFLGYDQLGTAMKQARELGMNGQIFGLSTLVSEAGRKLAGDAIEGALVVLWWAPDTPQLAAFKQRFETANKRAPLPDVFVAPAYDVGHLIAAALRAGGYEAETRRVNVDKVLDWLYSGRDFAGISGRFKIDKSGMSRGFNNIGIKTVLNRQLVNP